MRKLKALGLAFVAIGAISAVAAASASANYNIASAGGSISGGQVAQNVFTTDVGTVKCSSATFFAEQATETATTLTVQPTYKTCNLSGLGVTVDTTECHYLFNEPTTTTGGTTHAVADVKCPGGGVILIKDTIGAGCEVKVDEQTTGGKVKFTNNPGGTVLATSEVTGIDYSWTAGCPNAEKESGENTNGTYTGSVEVAGKDKGGTPVAVKVT